MTGCSFSPPSASPRPGIPAPYQPILDAYANAVIHGTAKTGNSLIDVQGTMPGTETSSLNFYRLADIDDNGTVELLIGRSSSPEISYEKDVLNGKYLPWIYKIFTLGRNGNPVLMYDSRGGSSVVYITPDRVVNDLMFDDHNSSVPSYYRVSRDGIALELIEQYWSAGTGAKTRYYKGNRAGNYVEITIEQSRSGIMSYNSEAGSAFRNGWQHIVTRASNAPTPQASRELIEYYYPNFTTLNIWATRRLQSLGESGSTTRKMPIYATPDVKSKVLGYTNAGDALMAVGQNLGKKIEWFAVIYPSSDFAVRLDTGVVRNVAFVRADSMGEAGHYPSLPPKELSPDYYDAG